MCFALFLTAILNIIIIPNIAIMLYLIIIYKCIYYATKYDLRDDERSVWTGWNSDSLTILAFLNSAVLVDCRGCLPEDVASHSFSHELPKELNACKSTYNKFMSNLRIIGNRERSSNFFCTYHLPIAYGLTARLNFALRLKAGRLQFPG